MELAYNKYTTDLSGRVIGSDLWAFCEQKRTDINIVDTAIRTMDVPDIDIDPRP